MKKHDILENPEILQTLKKEVKKHGAAKCTMGSVSVVLKKIALTDGKASPAFFQIKIYQSLQ